MTREERLNTIASTRAKAIFDKHHVAIAGCCINDPAARKAVRKSSLITVNEMLENGDIIINTEFWQAVKAALEALT